MIASRKPITRPDVTRVLDATYRTFDAIPPTQADTAACQAARNCLIVAFCALFNIRIKNLTAILLGKNLRHVGTRWRLMFIDDVKNGAAVLFDVPPELAGRIEIYVGTFRVALLGGRADHGVLWVARGGKPLSQGAVATGISKFSRTYLDRHLNSHVFRHAFAVITITRNPADADLAAAALGHTTEQMVQGTYTRSGSDEISRLWLKKLAQKRKGK